MPKSTDLTTTLEIKRKKQSVDKNVIAQQWSPPAPFQTGKDSPTGPSSSREIVEIITLYIQDLISCVC